MTATRDHEAHESLVMLRRSIHLHDGLGRNLEKGSEPMSELAFVVSLAVFVAVTIAARLAVSSSDLPRMHGFD